jgi:FAD:protein FMN transferase
MTGRQLAFEAIGTHWELDVYQAVPDAAWETVRAAVRERIETFDQAYSRFRSDSLVTTMAEAAGSYTLPPDGQALFDLYQELYGHTGGAMTPLIGRTLSDAGYDAQYSLQPPNHLVPPPAWEDVLDYQFPRLTLRQPALLDLGGAGKGYLVDLVGEVLEAHSLTAYCVDASGDMRYRRPTGEALRVGLEHPTDPTQVIGVAELPSGLSLCGSAGNRRVWAGYHHILDPRTLQSPREIAAVWVAAPSTLLADALTTAVFFVAPAALSAYYEFEYAIVQADFTLTASPGFPAEFFTT